VCVIEFCVLLHFNQIEYLLNNSVISLMMMMTFHTLPDMNNFCFPNSQM